MARWTAEQKLCVEAQTFKVLMARNEIFPLGSNSGLTGAWQLAQKDCGMIPSDERRENPTLKEIVVLKKSLNLRFFEYCGELKKIAIAKRETQAALARAEAAITRKEEMNANLDEAFKGVMEQLKKRNH